MAKAFFDTNVIVYAVSTDVRRARAEALMEQGGDISVQVLNEFASVARRKQKLDRAQIEAALAVIRVLARAIHPVNFDTHILALDLAKRYGFAIYDSLIVASAIRARCAILFSEDMQHGLVVNDCLRITNPFA